MLGLELGILNMGLPFKSSNNVINLVTIHDGYGSSIDIPSKGYVNSVEYSEAMQLVLTASDEGNLYSLEQRLVTLLLASRFNLDKKIKPEKLLVFEDGTPISAPLLKALYNHFINELGADADTLKFPFGHYSNVTQELKIDVPVAIVPETKPSKSNGKD